MKIVKDNFKYIIDAYKRFPLFIMISLITCIFFSAVISTDLVSDKTLDNVCAFSALLSCGLLFVEISHKKNDFIKIILFLLCLTVATIITRHVFVEFLFQRIAISYCIITVLLSIYTLVKSSNKKLDEYITKVFINLFKTGIIYGILTFGCAFLSFIINTLLFDTDVTFIRIEFLIIGFYLIPATVGSFIKLGNGKTDEFFNKAIKYVFFGMLVIEYIILYIYILKILITRNIPSNEVFPITTLLFINTLFINSMVSYVHENKLNKILPYLFIPVMLLQLYSVILRISEYGVTPLRYMAIMFIAVETIYLIYYIVCKKLKIELIPIIAFVVFESLLFPGINMYDVSFSEQYNRLSIYNEKVKLTKSDKEKIYSAYQFLDETKEGRKYIKRALSYNDIRKVRKFAKENKTDEYISFSIEDSLFNIASYSSLKEIHMDRYDINESVSETFREIKIDNKKIDMIKKVNGYIENKDDNIYFARNSEIKISKKSKFIIKQITIYLEDDKVNYYEIDGYLLNK